MADTHTELWRRWRDRRDGRAFADLVLPELSRAVAVARGAGCDAGLAEDAVQDALVQLAGTESDSPVELGVRVWLFRAVRDRARSALRSGRRRRAREARVAPSRPWPSPGEHAEASELVERALGELAPEEREAVRLRYAQDLDYVDVARVLGTSAATARVRVHRALERLRGRLGGNAATLLAALPLPIVLQPGRLVTGALDIATATGVGSSAGAAKLGTGSGAKVSAGASIGTKAVTTGGAAVAASKTVVWTAVIAFAVGALVGGGSALTLSSPDSGTSQRGVETATAAAGDSSGAPGEAPGDTRAARRRARADSAPPLRRDGTGNRATEDRPATAGGSSGGEPRAASPASGATAPHDATAISPGAWRDARTGFVGFHHGQGISLELGHVVETDVADLVFESAAGGLSSLTFRAPRGAISVGDLLGRVDHREQSGVDPRALYHSIGGINPERVGMPVRVRTDMRDKRTQVLLVRTRSGGWAKVLIAGRETEGGWQTRRVTLEYVINADAPSFLDLSTGATERVGLLITAPEGVRRLFESVQGSPPTPPETEPVERGDMPDAAVVEEVLYARSEFHDYERATYSFEHATRDDPDGVVRNDWDLEFQGRQFNVRMVTDDTSEIVDLGEMSWADVAGGGPLPQRYAWTAPVHAFHVYLVRTRDSESALTTLLRVKALDPDLHVALEWISVRKGKVSTSPRFPVGGDERAALERRLRDIDAGGRAPRAGDESAGAARTLGALVADRGSLFLGDGWTLARLATELTDAGVPASASPEIPDVVSTTPLDAGGEGITLADLLDMASRQLGLQWSVEPTGAVRFVPVPR